MATIVVVKRGTHKTSTTNLLHTVNPHQVLKYSFEEVHMFLKVTEYMGEQVKLLISFCKAKNYSILQANPIVRNCKIFK